MDRATLLKMRQIAQYLALRSHLGTAPNDFCNRLIEGLFFLRFTTWLAAFTLSNRGQQTASVSNEPALINGDTYAVGVAPMDLEGPTTQLTHFDVGA